MQFNIEPAREGVAEDREGRVPVDAKENGIGGYAADSAPVPPGHAGCSEGETSPSRTSL